MSTLQRAKHKGECGLPDVEVTCKTLVYNRILTMGARDGFVTSELLRFWNVVEALTNPP